MMLRSFLILMWAGLAPLQAATEAEPTLPARELLGAGKAIAGEHWRLHSPVPVRGYLGQFALQTASGSIPVQGLELLEIRIAEIPALEALEQLRGSEVFAHAIADSAQAAGRAVVRVVTHPAQTIEGIPAGVGRLLRRTAGRVRDVAVAVGDAARRDPAAGTERAQDDGSVDKARDFAAELAGVNKARRALARSAGVDPYTSNPLLQARLEDLAWASVAGGLSLDLALGAVGGLSDVLATSGRLDSLVWDLPPADIRRQLEQTLKARGCSPRMARELLRNRHFTPTLQLALVDGLRGLGQPAGEAEVLKLATTVASEIHARFLIQQLQMLAQHVPASDPVAELLAFDASIAARTRSGTLWITLPVDHLSWTEEVGGAVAGYSEPAPRLVVAGSVSPLARRELARTGWRLSSGVGLAD
jgi:hypothetical protein